jgi:hypothetical protein
MVTDGNVTGVLERVRQMYCGLHGHDSLLQFGQDRMFLKCTTCGHESPGWEITESAPAPSVQETTRKPEIMRPHLVGARRVA